MIEQILLAVDGSKTAQHATDVAAELASKLNADLVILHVMMHGRPPKELVHMAEVEHLVKEVQAVVSADTPYVKGSHVGILGGDKEDPRTARIITVLGEQIVKRAEVRCAELGALSIKSMVVSGDTAEEILSAAGKLNADMIVVGSRGLGRLKSTILGSVSQKVLHHADCSVVTVR